MDPSVWIGMAVVAVAWGYSAWRHGHRTGYRNGYEAGKEWGQSEQHQPPGDRH